MKTIYTLLICFAFSLTAFGQNYQPFNASNEAWYECSGNPYNIIITVANPLLPIKIDSVTLNQDGSETHHHYRIFSGKIDNNYCYILDDTSWTGTATILTPNTAIFYNKQQEPITIAFDKLPGETWVMYTTSNGDYIEGAVINELPTTFLGVTDSVKTVQLVAKDINGNPLSQHPLHQTSIKLSKNYGFLTALNFADFPIDNSTITLAGHDNIAEGVQDIGFSDIFNFNIGFERHFKHYYFDPFTEVITRYQSLTVINKDVYNNGDSLVYTMSQKVFEEIWYADSNNTVTSFTQDTIQETYALSFVPEINQFPYEITNNNPAFWVADASTLYVDNTINGRLSKKLNGTIMYDQSISCWSQLIDGCGNYQYLEGLGGPYNIFCGGSNYVEFLYYKKGSEEWGNPINFNALTSTNRMQKSNLKVTIAPNPMTEQTIFTLEKNTYQNVTLTIFNIVGQQVKTVASNGDNRIIVDRNGLNSGVYFYQIQAEGLVLNSGKLMVD